MRNKLFLFVLFLLLVNLQLKSSLPTFTRGVNLTGWFQTGSARQIQFTQFTKTDFENIKSLGCDVIRLPINLFYMTSGNPNYEVDTLFFEFLDEAVNWAEELEIHLIIDNHSTDDIASKNPNLSDALQKVWTQVANRYKNRSSYVLYEIMNEPNGISTQNWGNIQQLAINAIRTVDTVHYIVVGASNYNTYNELTLLPQYTDDKLIYTFHFYDPFLFTHQGATWVSPSMASISNIPFPYNSAKMPDLSSNYSGTWVESLYNNYNNDGTVSKIRQLIDIAVNFKDTRNVPIYCGELGVYIPNSPDSDRIEWYRQVRTYLEEKNIPWTMWDYQGGFGLFRKGTSEMFNFDLNLDLLAALGFNIPAQDSFRIVADSTGIEIYTDYIGVNIREASYANGATIDYYSSTKPNNGKYCIQWHGAAQYGTIGLNFVSDKDFSYLYDHNYAVSMLVRGTTPGTKFDIRFIDTKTDVPGDHPWRIKFTIDENVAGPWDGKWHKIFIPLLNFIEGGSWDNDEQKWYNPIAGAFDWSAVDRFEIANEYGLPTNAFFWFDNILIVNVDSAFIYDTTQVYIPNSANYKSFWNNRFEIFPNPINANSIIRFTINKKSNVEIQLFSFMGQQLGVIRLKNLEAGVHQLPLSRFNTSLKSGVYVCKFNAHTDTLLQKIIIR